MLVLDNAKLNHNFSHVVFGQMSSTEKSQRHLSDDQTVGCPFQRNLDFDSNESDSDPEIKFLFSKETTISTEIILKESESGRETEGDIKRDRK